MEIEQNYFKGHKAQVFLHPYYSSSFFCTHCLCSHTHTHTHTHTHIYMNNLYNEWLNNLYNVLKKHEERVSLDYPHSIYHSFG